MRRMNSVWGKPAIACFAWMGAAFLLAASPAMATPATLDSSGFGFDSVGLEGLPVVTIDTTDFLLAGEAGSAPNLVVQLVGSQDLCILVGTDGLCRTDPTGVTGDFTALVSFTVEVLQPGLVGDTFTLFLNNLVDTGYDLADVTVELNPPNIANLNRINVPDFAYDGTYDEFVHLEMTDIGGTEVFYDYIGWTVSDGDLVTFRYDVVGGAVGGVAPQFTANVTALVVPEPGTALLMGLGLFGLTLCSGRRG